ncbi:uncharacterized protein LOC133560207 [Nerophis ophidion]|uniref:uncharacterized protein LOC133560207 n=1 Tax=Nerophis ophidion TaxID=159077 RepID=UPI002ADFB314|nr:uncharacterized protein LOC133560207 [Nerophis ophidion]
MSYDMPRRAAVLPPCSNRTLHHPSFMSLYMAAQGKTRPKVQGSEGPSQTVPCLSPPEVFYNDPTLWGVRIPNTVANLESQLSFFQLNTRPLLVSSFEAPPMQADPKRTHLSSANVHPSVIHLSPDELLAIQCLLKLPHQVQFTNIAEPPVAWRDTNGLGLAAGDDEENGRWSNAELEAAHTLMGGFVLRDEGTVMLQSLPDGWTEQLASCEPEWIGAILIDAVEIYEEYFIPLLQTSSVDYIVDVDAE